MAEEVEAFRRKKRNRSILPAGARSCLVINAKAPLTVALPGPFATPARAHASVLPIYQQRTTSTSAAKRPR